MSKHIGNLSTSRAAKPSMLAVSTEIQFQSCFFYYCENSVFQNTIISGYNYVYVCIVAMLIANDEMGYARWAALG